MSNDQVHHPKRYRGHASGLECIDLTQWMTFCFGNATKYLWRQGQKDGAPSAVDVQKAAWYLRREAAAIRSEGHDGTTFPSDTRRLARKVLDHEPDGTPLARLLTLISLGWIPCGDLIALANEIDPEGAKL